MVVLLPVFIFATFVILTLVKGDRKTTGTPRETVELFGKLLDKNDKASMEEFVRTVPALYRKQINARAPQFRNNGSPRPGHVIRETNTLREAPPAEPTDIPRSSVNTTKLLDKVARGYLFEQNRYIKQIGEVIEKDNQAIVSAAIASKTDENISFPTKFWLVREKDGQWRIFQITDFEMNPQWAQSTSLR